MQRWSSWRRAVSVRGGRGGSRGLFANRVSLNAPASVEQLESGLQILKALIDSPPSAAMDP